MEGLLADLAKFGVASVKRIYGHWTASQLRGWKGVLLQQDERKLYRVEGFGVEHVRMEVGGAVDIDIGEILIAAPFGQNPLQELAAGAGRDGDFYLGKFFLKNRRVDGRRESPIVNVYLAFFGGGLKGPRPVAMRASVLSGKCRHGQEKKQ